MFHYIGPAVGIPAPDMGITKLINNFIGMKNLKKFFFNIMPFI